MIEKHNVSYGSVEPSAKAYEQDHVIINSDVTKVVKEDESYEWIAGTVQFYTYNEYVQMQDAALIEQQHVNDEQDELIAEILEGQ